MHHLTQLAGRYVASLYDTHLPVNRIYHDLAHTECVVRAAGMIGLHVGLSAEEQTIVNLAAWFHDTGHTTTYEGHEIQSERLARAFLVVHGVESAAIEEVARCIRATTMPQRPGSLMESVLCDADLYYLSTDSFDEGQAQLRKEWGYARKQFWTDEDWRMLNVRFFSEHLYHTEYGRTVLEARKREQFARWLLRYNAPAPAPSRPPGLRIQNR